MFVLYVPGNENVVASKYGPIVLSADLGTGDMTTESTSVNVTVPTLFIDISDVFAITDGSTENWLANITEPTTRAVSLIRLEL